MSQFVSRALQDILFPLAKFILWFERKHHCIDDFKANVGQFSFGMVTKTTS